MENERCKFCETRKHGPKEMHLCPALKSDSPPATISVKKVEPMEGAVLPPGALVADVVDVEKECLKIRMTNAERHKRFRDKHGEAYRRRNRERMAAKRKETKDG